MTESVLDTTASSQPARRAINEEEDSVSLLDLAVPIVRHRRLLAIAPLLVGVAVYGLTHLIAPTFTARTTFLPPQQQQSSAASALSSLGALAGIAGAASIKSPAEQYVALMQSTTVANRLVDQFKLMDVYESKYRVDAQKRLADNVRISASKKDGLISVEVDDKSPQRAADLANQHVEELRRLTSVLAVTEAQQRRVFFEKELQRTKQSLITAQQVLQASGFNAGALKAEPKSAAEEYARLRAAVTASDVALQSMRSVLTENSVELQQQQSRLAALRTQLARAEQSTTGAGADGDYVSKYREFKYQETLFDLFARQYELARVDESREGALIQVVDAATPPERRSAPKRGVIALAALFFTLLMLTAFVISRHFWQESSGNPLSAKKRMRLRAAMLDSKS
jgi:uncharacterized protein involved in exopolysaccharide biosynthesis